jgi:hypothetical protein
MPKPPPPPRHQRRDSGRGLLVFAVTFLCLTGLSQGLFALLPRHTAARVRAQASLEDPPPGDEWYLAIGVANADHHILFHELDPRCLESLRAADVVFLSNSRLQWAGSHPTFRRALRDAQIRYFLLGLAHNEADVFPRALIERLDLRPRVAVINVDRFFRNWISTLAARTVEDSAWAARVYVWEQGATFQLRRWLHSVYPYLPAVGWKSDARAFYRSRVDGAWWHTGAPAGGLPLPRPRHQDPSQEDLAAAEAFVAFLRARGTEVVLTWVPNRENTRRWAETLASRLGLPLVAPDLRDLTTYDYSHLDEPSADRFTTALAPLLIPELRAHLER